MNQAELHRQAFGVIQQSGRKAEPGQFVIDYPESTDNKGGCHKSTYRTKVLY